MLHAVTSSPETTCKMTITYHPCTHELASEMEQWDANYCALYHKDINVRKSILMAAKQANELKDNRLQSLNHSAHLSYFEITHRCVGKATTMLRAIEPLYGIFRHPEAVYCHRGKPTVIKRKAKDTEYLVTDDATRFNIQAERQNFYFDLGSSIYHDLSQEKMLLHYEERGIHFHRHLLWEANPMDPVHLFRVVPARFHSAYQFFNTPVNAEQDDRNPLNILKKIATRDDFVVVKLDIDNSAIEQKFVSQILNDEMLASLVDEFFWEPHFHFHPFLKCCWRDTADTNLSAHDVHLMFSKMRHFGIRAHGWP